jgi:hypothetical protein
MNYSNWQDGAVVATTLTQNTAKLHRSSIPTQSKMAMQRKCACGGSGASSVTGECAECGANRLQTKLRIGSSNEPLEQEPDRVADQAMDAAHLTGETREGVGTALCAAVQPEIPF